MQLLILLLFFFFSNLTVNAKTYETPYLKVGEVTKDYEVSSIEKIEPITYYEQEKITKDYKYLETATSNYPIKTNDIKYGKYSLYTKTKSTKDNIEIETKLQYHYQELKKLSYLEIENLNNLTITNLKLFYKDELIYAKENINAPLKIILKKAYSPEFLNLELTCFLNQGDKKGSFKISNSNYLKIEKELTTKGFTTMNLKLINNLEKLEYEEEVKITDDLSDKFYIKVLKEEKFYRFRKIYYKYYEDTKITSDKVLEGYQVINTFSKYYLYRKEKIVTYDDIILNDYIDVDKVIKSSTIPLSKLNFTYNESTSSLLITYQDYEIKIPITFNYTKTKSTVTKGKVKSLKRELFAFLLSLRQFL